MGFEINNKIGRGRKLGSVNKATISIKDNFQNDYSDNNSFQNEQIQAPNENI